MPKKQSGEKELYWRELMQRQAESGLSVRQFCVREGVSEPSFYAWRQRLGGGWKRKAEGASGRAAGLATNGREFIPLELIEASAALELIHPRGYRIRVTGPIDASNLQRLLDVLDGRQEA